MPTALRSRCRRRAPSSASSTAAAGSPSRNSLFALEPVLLRDLRGVLAASKPGVASGEFAVEVAEERVDPRGLLAARTPVRSGSAAPCLPSPAMPPQCAGVEPVHRARPWSSLRVRSRPRQDAEQVGDDLVGVVDGRACRAGRRRRGAGTGRMRRGRRRRARCAVRPARAGRVKPTPTSTSRSSSPIAQGSMRCRAGQLLEPVEAVLGEAVDVDRENAAQLVEQDPGKLLALRRR